MPEAATTVRVPIPLESFEGVEVIGAKIKITNAGDGLSEALAIDPQAFHHGEKLYVVLETDVVKVTHTDVKDTGALMREHTLRASGATIVDATLVADLVQAQKEAILRAKEAAAGIERLPFEDSAHEQPDDTVSALRSLTNDQLLMLCDANGITVGRKAKKDRLVELLAEVPGIHAAAASFETVPDHDEANVASLDDHRED